MISRLNMQTSVAAAFNTTTAATLKGNLGTPSKSINPANAVFDGAVVPPSPSSFRTNELKPKDPTEFNNLGEYALHRILLALLEMRRADSGRA